MFPFELTGEPFLNIPSLVLLYLHGHCVTVAFIVLETSVENLSVRGVIRNAIVFFLGISLITISQKMSNSIMGKDF